VKQLMPLLALVSILGLSVLAQSGERTGSMGGTVTDSEGAVIENATVTVRNTETQFTQFLTTGKHGDFRVENLSAGNYTVDAWHRFFERSSQIDIVILPGQMKELRFKLDFCGVMHHLDPHQQNFTARIEVKAGSDYEKDLANKAEGLPCRPNANASSPLGEHPPRCANLATMKVYSDLVEKNKAGHLPEAGEGPVHAGAYFGATVEFDRATRRWKVKLRLEYSVTCGMLCGIFATYDRWVYFDLRGTVTKVDDDCGCNLEAIS